MTDRILVRRGVYLDSVALMLASQEAAAVPGVSHASAVNATPLNVELLERQDFDLRSEGELGPNDLVLAVRADDDASAQAALEAIEAGLRSDPVAGTGAAAHEAPRSIGAAARARPDLNLAVISVPGQHAVYECARALDAGLHVFCFSDGPPLEDELALKRRALELGLLMMGPDCGTAVIDGVGLGFANVLDSGPVGIVGASGTGIQALSTMLDSAGIGISHAIGVGGRDLSSHVGGLMTLRGIELLAADPDTEVLAVISKAPDGAVARAVADAAGDAGKPFVLAFPGLSPGEAEAIDAEVSLEGAAARAAELAGGSLPEPAEGLDGPPTPGAIRGLFCGGTLRDEAAWIISAAGANETDSALVDYGNDEYTRGRPHPMIDPSLRNAAMERELGLPEVGVVLADVVLGHGAHPDPAAELSPLIARGLSGRERPATVVISLCGAARDPQDVEAQAARLRSAGAIVTRSNAHAARLALAAAGLGAGVG